MSCDTFRRASWPYRVTAKSPPAQRSRMLLKGQSGPQTSLREATPSSRTNKCERGTWWASIAHQRKIVNQNGAGPSSNDIRVGLRQNRSAHRMRVGSPSHPLAVRPTHYIMQTMHRNEGPRSIHLSLSLLLQESNFIRGRYSARSNPSCAMQMTSTFDTELF